MTDIPGRGQKPPLGFQRDDYLVDGRKTVVYSGGEGRPFVFWHGAGTFHGIDFAREWTRDRKVILPYHPGFGETADDPGYETIGDYLRHYLTLFDVLGLREFDLGGISMGGWMAAEFALAHPGRVRKLVLAAPGGIFDPAVDIPDLGSIPEDELLSYLAHDPSVFDAYLPKSDAEATSFNAMLAGEGRTLAKLLPQGPFRPGLEDEVSGLTMPTLLLWGRQDRVLPVALAESWRTRLPNAEVRVFDNAGHVLLDESAEARQAVTEFLNR